MTRHAKQYGLAGAIFAAAFAFASFNAAPALADASWDACAGSDLDARIVGCTEVLARGNKETAVNRGIAHFNRGNAYRDKGNTDRAMADYNEAIRLNPKHASAYNGRGNVYFDLNDLNRAIKDYDQSIKLDPRDSLAFANRATTYQHLGNYDKAIADFNVSLRLDPNRVFANYNRGLAYNSKGDLDKAIADFDKTLQLQPNHPTANYDRALSFYRKGDYDGAISGYSESIRINPTHANSYTGRGLSYYEKGDYPRSIEDYNEALRIDPTSALTYNNRGYSYYRLGDCARAIQDYNTALQYDPNHDRAKANLDVAVADQRAGKCNVNVAINNPPPKVDNTNDRPKAIVPADSNDIRVALVIGNSSYTAVSRLSNPPNDAKAVAEALREAGFETVEIESDVGRAQFISALNDFADRAAAADWAVFYFAGHGMEMDGINYLIPVDAQLRFDRDLQDEAISLDRVITAVESARKLRLVILDACRNNPFANSMKLTVASRNVTRGLARIEPTGGTLVAYAAKGGQVALDESVLGDGNNSPFASALVERLREPNLEIGKLFRLVRDDVLRLTGKKQEPFLYGSLPAEDFFFRVN